MIKLKDNVEFEDLVKNFEFESDILFINDYTVDVYRNKSLCIKKATREIFVFASFGTYCNFELKLFMSLIKYNYVDCNIPKFIEKLKAYADKLFIWQDVKIKDGVNLKELIKYGFEYIYDEFRDKQCLCYEMLCIDDRTKLLYLGDIFAIYGDKELLKLLELIENDFLEATTVDIIKQNRYEDEFGYYTSISKKLFLDPNLNS